MLKSLPEHVFPYQAKCLPFDLRCKKQYTHNCFYPKVAVSFLQSNYHRSEGMNYWGYTQALYLLNDPSVDGE